jgi:hypothetical protein
MLNSKQILVLVSAFLAETQALNAHRHAHQQAHALMKKDTVFRHTAYTTVTAMVTVTEYEGDSPSTKEDYSEKYAPASSAPAANVAVAPTFSAAPPPPPPPPPPAETQVAPPPPPPAETPSAQAQAVVPDVPAASVGVDLGAGVGVSVGTGGAGGGFMGSSKRGMAYNNGGLLNLFSGSKCTWSYNWAQTPDGSAPGGTEYVPMMWGPTHESGWEGNAERMIAEGAKNFLSFNECDHDAQCNMRPGDAAREHIRLMNKYQGRVRISTPAITNSGDPNQGIGWLRQFLGACGGQCAYDFCAVHWYSPPNVKDFLDHMKDAHSVCGKPIWITEFAPIGVDDAGIDDFLGKVMTEMDTNPEYSFIERYSYFMVADGILTSGNGLSRYGKTFAFS